MQRGQAAQRLWRNLIQACRGAAEKGLSSDELGYTTVELGLSVLALDFSKEELVTYVANLNADLAADRLAAVNGAFRVQGLSIEAPGTAWSWLTSLSGLSQAHPLWAERQLRELEALLAYTPSRLFGSDHDCAD
jgi:hypothetical protein